MVAAAGGGGRVPTVRNSGGDVPVQKSRFLTKMFQNKEHFFRFSENFKSKQPKSEEKKEFGVGGFHAPESVSPIQNFVASSLLFLHVPLTRAPMGVPKRPPPLFFRELKNEIGYR